MTADLDTLLTALYVFVDDQILPVERRRPGRPKQLTDAELVCLAVAQVMLDCPSQARWLRFCYCRLGKMFPYLPKQPGYCKRINAAGPLLDKTLHALATQVSVDSDAFRFIDATPVPCGTSRPTRQRSDLAGWANYGYCASHSRWYWGLKLYLVTTAHGMPVAWCLADPKLGEREVALELLGHARDHHLLPQVVVLIGDKGFSGHGFEVQAAELNVRFIRPDRRDETRRHGNLAGIRQLIGPSTTPPRDSCRWKDTAGEPPPGSTPASPSVYSPWPPPSGTTASPARRPPGP